MATRPTGFLQMAPLASAPNPRPSPSAAASAGDSVARTFGLIGVPSSAGAHTPGQERGPEAMRRAGILERLVAAGCSVQDHGDLPMVRSRPDPANRRAQNLPLVV